MPSVCMYFHVHQPWRIKRYRIFDVGVDHNYFNESQENDLNNKKVFLKVARKCYLPTNKILLDLLKKHKEFKISFSITGTVIEQMLEFDQNVLQSFQELVDTGRVEIIGETYYHSLAFLYSKEEFKHQVEKHKKIIKKYFGLTPKVFRNTELIYNNDLAREIEKMGYKAILAEGADHILGWRSPDFVYRPKGTKKIALLLKNYKLSDDIAFRFSSRDWAEFPLTAQKFSSWVNQINGNGQIVNLFMDYETFGEHQWEHTGIFDFLKHLPSEILKHKDNNFVTPIEATKKYKPVGEIDSPQFVSWADVERDLSAWVSNSMQSDAITKLYSLGKLILASKKRNLIEDFRHAQTSDHFYYMCTKWFADGDVHKYFNPYESPYDAFISYMNVITDLSLRLEEKPRKKSKKN